MVIIEKWSCDPVCTTSIDMICYWEYFRPEKEAFIGYLNSNRAWTFHLLVIIPILQAHCCITPPDGFISRQQWFALSELELLLPPGESYLNPLACEIVLSVYEGLDEKVKEEGSGVGPSGAFSHSRVLGIWPGPSMAPTWRVSMRKSSKLFKFGPRREVGTCLRGRGRLWSQVLATLVNAYK